MKPQGTLVENLYEPGVSSVLSATSNPLRHTSLGAVRWVKGHFCSFLIYYLHGT